MLPTPTSRDARPRRLKAWVVAACLAVVVAGCTDPRQAPAEQAIVEIEAALVSAGTAPAKYIPGELKEVQTDLEELKRDFERRDYDRVLDAAPAVLAAARALAQSAKAREAELHEALRVQWAALVQSVPAELAAVADRFDGVAARNGSPAGPTAAEVGIAKSRLRDALALWDRARQEAAAGRLPEAVTLAHQVRELGRTVDALSRAGAVDPTVK